MRQAYTTGARILSAFAHSLECLYVCFFVQHITLGSAHDDVLGAVACLGASKDGRIPRKVRKRALRVAASDLCHVFSLLVPCSLLRKQEYIEDPTLVTPDAVTQSILCTRSLGLYVLLEAHGASEYSH